MEEDILFHIEDPLGNIVVLRKSTYEKHIKYKHSEILAKDIKGTIQSPEYIIRDNNRVSNLDYYAHSSYNYENHYVKTSVSFDKSVGYGTASVATAHLTEEISPLPSCSEDVIYGSTKVKN